MLFVPADSDRKIAKAACSAADALILDLEDGVAPDSRPAARALCAETLKASQGKRLFVRINGLDTPDALQDLAAVVGGAPYGIMLPKCRSADDVRILDRYLSALEVREGLPPGNIKVLPIMTETCASLLAAGGYRPGEPRLVGMFWGGEDLAADMGARASRDTEGRYKAPFELARTFCLLAAGSARVAAVDAVFTDFRNLTGLRQEAEAAARDGFTAKVAIHPDQVAVINEAFTPNDAEAVYARRVIDAFDASPGAAVVALDARMLDGAHLVMARRVLARVR